MPTRPHPLTAIFAFVALSLGCTQSLENQLGLTYVAPKVPNEVPSRFKPEPHTKIESWLKDGETHLDLKAHYLDAHRCGWDAAIRDWERYHEFKLRSKNDAYSYRADIPSGTQALWIGYSDACRQIEAAVSTRTPEAKDGG